MRSAVFGKAYLLSLPIPSQPDIIRGMNRAVLFDMDGVLIDSVTLNWIAYNKVLARENVRIDQDKMHRYVGRPLRDQVAMFNADLGLHIDAQAFEDEVSALREASFNDIKPKAGVVALVQGLRQAGILTAVGTSTSRDIAERRLATAGIIDYFDTIITEDDVQNHKPDPDVYLLAAYALHVSPDVCVVIEDAPSGITAAKAAGMACIAVRTAYTLPEQLTHATSVVASLADVTPEYIQHLGR